VAGQAIQGPAIIESMDSTSLVPPGWTATADAKGYIIMEVKGDG
jgi:N-methylhydantoinase A/oxoprolinase/acetone carboxylase beta subunit